MKKLHVFVLVATALVIGFITAHWCDAQSPDQPANEKQAGYDFGTLQQLNSLMTYLEETKQTNTLQRFNNYLNTSLTLQNYSDLGVTLAVLQRLRDGRTNQACEVLESQMDADIVGFATTYRQMPASAREQCDLKFLSWAKDYRAKYPNQRPSAIIDEGVANAFKLLDSKP
jgi:hypothetical protein